MDSNKKKKEAAPAAAPASPDAKRTPIKTIRVEDVSASVWTRQHPVQGETRTFYSVTLERSYKDRDGAYRYTKSFDADDLGKVVAACQQASEFIAALSRPAA
jgi:hypothetical protein